LLKFLPHLILLHNPAIGPKNGEINKSGLKYAQYRILIKSYNIIRLNQVVWLKICQIVWEGHFYA